VISGKRAGLPVARYLRPEEKVVPFRARPELDELLDWCGGDRHVGVQLVTGPGGAGKTRLALRLGQEMDANGWRQLWVPRGLEGETARAVREAGTPCVVVVDYAETRAGLGGLLGDVAGDFDGPDIRVVLLARGSGEWWQQLVTSGDERVATLLAAPPVMLGSMSVDGGQAELFAEALTAFAEKLGVDLPDTTLKLTDPEPVVLVVHAAALLAVLDHDQGISDNQARSGAEVLAGLLAHEGRYWAQSAAARGLDLDVAVQRLAVVAGCLIGADSEATAGALMARIPDLADSAERRGKVARWLRDLYPETSPGEAETREWIGPLRPDPVAEHLVVAELNDRKDLVPRLFTSLDEDRAARALTVLARAAYTQPSGLNLLRSALAADLEHLAVPALSVAVETNPVLGDLLSETLQTVQVSAGTLEQIASTAPYPSFALAAPVAFVLEQLADRTESDGERARWLVDLSNRLGDLGRREEALSAIEQAVAIHRQLAEDHPDEFLPCLARSLNNQSGCLARLGRREEAHAAIEQAIAIRRRLAEDRADESLLDLAVLLHNQSEHLAQLWRREEALAAIEQAIAIQLQLAEARPDALLPDYLADRLARSLNNQSLRLADLERWEEALAAIEQAVAIRIQLAEARPDAFLPDLAMSLDAQSNALAGLGRRDAALAAIEEAVDIRRRLAQARPDAFLPDLAASLNDQSNRLAQMGRQEEALAAIEEASAAYRRLAQARPEVFLRNLAASLDTQSGILAGLERQEEALAVIADAVSISRQLADADVDASLPNLAVSLSNHARCLAGLGRGEEALAAVGEAIAIYRQLDSGAFLPGLAGSLNNQSNALAGLGRREEALAAIEEATAIYRHLAEGEYDAFLPDLAMSLNNLANRLDDLCEGMSCGHETRASMIIV
jgi:tetratricopeptide (TPR) repeat protein